MDFNDVYLLRDSPVPLWSQIRSAILSKIVTEAVEPGAQLLPETTIADALGVSRATVRRAIQSLEQEGLITRTRGRGTFVAPAPTAEIGFPPLGFYQRMTASGHEVRSEVLHLETIQPTPKQVQKLRLCDDDAILHIRRLRYLDGDPVLISSNHLVHKLCPGMEDEDLRTGSLWARVARMTGRGIAGGIHTFKAVVPSQEERASLNISRGTALLRGQGINYLTDGTPFEQSTVNMVGNRSFVRVRYSYVGRPSLPVESELRGRKGGLQAEDFMKRD